MSGAATTRSTRLGTAPLVDPTASLTATTLGRYTEIARLCTIAECEIGDYSYLMQHCEAWSARIGKFANIASHVRINAANHPSWRATQHHFTYRAGDYWPDAGEDEDVFAWRRAASVEIGHDVWVGHGATILPGVTIGDGAVIGAGAVVSRNVAPYEIVGGVPARRIRMRFPAATIDRLQTLAWWDWSHERLRAALDDFRRLDTEQFLAVYEGRQ